MCTRARNDEATMANYGELVVSVSHGAWQRLPHGAGGRPQAAVETLANMHVENDNRT